jgi:hypothetical protein
MAEYSMVQMTTQPGTGVKLLDGDMVKTLSIAIAREGAGA